MASKSGFGAEAGFVTRSEGHKDEGRAVCSGTGDFASVVSVSRMKYWSGVVGGGVMLSSTLSSHLH